MLRTISKNWWLFGLRGLFAVIFGVLAFIWPGTTITALVLVFGAYAFVDGIFSLVAGFADANYRWWIGLLEGVVGLLAGIAAFVWPGITAFAFVYLIAAWALLTGLMEISAAVQLRKEISGEWLLAISGVASVIFGIALAFFPSAGMVTLIWLIGAYALLFGLLTIFLAFKLRGYRAEGEGEGKGYTINPRSA